MKAAKEEYYKAIHTLKIKYPSAQELLTFMIARGFAIDGLVHEDEDANVLDSEVSSVDQALRRALRRELEMPSMCIHKS